MGGSTTVSFFCVEKKSQMRLAFLDRAVRTCFSARTAANANIRIDFILVTFADSASWANRCASTTCYTSVINYVCHSCENFIS